MPEFKMVRFLKDFEASMFEGSLYGPFKKGVLYALPVMKANQLIKMQAAEDVKREVQEPSLKDMFKGEVLSGYVEASRSRTLNQFQKTPEEIEVKRQEVLNIIRKNQEEIQKLKKLAEEL